jgi:endonuclease YncB( thermonuclease family)
VRRRARPATLAAVRLPLAPRAAALAAVALLAAILVTRAEDRRPEVYFDARVVRVFDGDTVEVVRDPGPEGGRTERLRIRLHGIDAPERGQPWSRRAREALARRALGKSVRINAVDTDRYGRTVGELYADDVCVGCELVRDGHVWVYRHYTDDRLLLALEADARAARRGLWALPEAERIPPWEWRAREREREAAKR